MIREIISAYYDEFYHIEKLEGMTEDETAEMLADTADNGDNYNENDE